MLCCALRHCHSTPQDEARARAEAQAKAKEDQRRKQEEARAAAAEAARKKQVCAQQPLSWRTAAQQCVLLC
jgi:hypothetical protein